MADTSQQTFEKMKDMRALLDEHDPAIKKIYESVSKDLRSAIGAESADEIAIARPRLDTAIERIDESLDACDRLHVMTTKLLPDTAFVASKREEIGEIVKHVAVAKNRLSGWASAARSLGQEADQALAKIKDSGNEIEAELGGLKNRGAKLTNVVNKCKAEFPNLEKTAREATGKGNEKDAERARLAIFDLMKVPKNRAGELRPLLEKFKKDHPDLDRDKKAELTWVGDALWDADDVLKSGDQLFMDLIKLKQASLAAKPAKMPEVPKSVLIDVAVAIGIDAKDAKDSRTLDAIAKVLNTTPHDKWADGLAKLATTLKLKGANGKTMVIAIDKLPYFKKQLIDI
jgi:hypothetical protein